MENVKRIVDAGICVGCGACMGCEHLHMQRGPLGFDVPVADEGCKACGQCVSACIYDPMREDD